MKVTMRVTIGELVLRNSELDLLEVVHEIGQHTTCRIEFTRDSATDVSLDQLLRDPVVVSVKAEGREPVEIFRGAIGDGTQSHLLNAGSRFALHALSPSERLDFVDTVYFPESTINSIAGKFGVKIAGSLRRTPKPFDHVQWGESEFTFIRRLADEHGGFLVTSGAEPEIRTEFVDKGWELLWGDTLLEVTARARPVNHGAAGASYETKTKSTHVHAGIRQAPPSLGGAAKLVGALAELARGVAGSGDPGLELATARDTTHADFKAALRRESERDLGAAVLVEGVSALPGLAAGDLVTLVPGTNFQLPTTGKFGLIKVTHLFTDQQYAARFVGTPWKNFTGLERPAVPTLAGPVTAEVVETASDPEKMGRVKVAYRWQGGSNTNWARVVTPHAGNGRGMLFLPEIGDEVLVIFEAGDPEQPIVVGSLWNGRDLPPEATSDNNAKRLVTKSGNTIQLLDDPDAETIEIFTASGKCMLQMTNKGGHPVVTIHSEGDIALQATEEIRIKCKKLVQDIETDSVKKVGGDESIDAGKNVTIKAGMDAGLAGLNAVIKGAMNVESVAGALNNVVGALVHIQPPGFQGKPVSPKPAKAAKADLGKRDTPKVAAPDRSADAKTPRG